MGRPGRGPAAFPRAALRNPAACRMTLPCDIFHKLGSFLLYTPFFARSEQALS
jgi:hypothetical protein